MNKSKFDTGKWSDVNGLPGQDDIINYLEHLLLADPNKCFTRRGLMDSVINEFGIPATNAEAEGPKSNTTGFYTRMTYLITDAIQGKRRADGNQFAKRLSLGVYQHINGNGVISEDILKERSKKKNYPKRAVEEARVSVRILKNLTKKLDETEIFCELAGRCWSDEIIERAIELEFHPEK
jgi:hypothetical protein